MLNKVDESTNVLDMSLVVFSLTSAKLMKTNNPSQKSEVLECCQTHSFTETADSVVFSVAWDNKPGLVVW